MGRYLDKSVSKLIAVFKQGEICNVGYFVIDTILQIVQCCSHVCIYTHSTNSEFQRGCMMLAKI